MLDSTTFEEHKYDELAAIVEASMRGQRNKAVAAFNRLLRYSNQLEIDIFNNFEQYLAEFGCTAGNIVLVYKTLGFKIPDTISQPPVEVTSRLDGAPITALN